MTRRSPFIRCWRTSPCRRRGLQVSASALLLIAAAVYLRSAFAAATFESGVRTSDTVGVQIVNEPTRNAIVQAVTAEASVAAVAASWPDAPGAAFAEANGVTAAVGYKFVSPEDSACSMSRSCGDGRSRRPSARRISRWPLCPRRPHARCGRMPTRSARSSGSTRIPRPNPRVATSPPSSHRRSR